MLGEIGLLNDLEHTHLLMQQQDADGHASVCVLKGQRGTDKSMLALRIHPAACTNQVLLGSQKTAEVEVTAFLVGATTGKCSHMNLWQDVVTETNIKRRLTSRHFQLIFGAHPNYISQV